MGSNKFLVSEKNYNCNNCWKTEGNFLPSIVLIGPAFIGKNLECERLTDNNGGRKVKAKYHLDL
jgi:hypothetical protein